jgi:thiol:disulfide interchange protein DsbD
MLKILSLFFISINLLAEILPAEKAFVPSAKVENGNLVVDFKIEDEYYLYKDKISIKTADSAKLGESSFSKSKTKNDDFFGEVEIYHNKAKITTPIKSADKTINFEVKSQGCWEGGVCYPPTVQKLSVKNTANQNNQLSNKSNFFKALTQQSGINDPASVDIAFKFDAFKVDENTIKATWKIRDGYYMYHDKFNFAVDGADFGKIIFPEGEPKKDDFFGDITIHKKQLVIDLPLKNIGESIDLTVNYQGCWEGGVCYPPVEKKTTIQMVKIPKNIQKTEENQQKIAKLGDLSQKSAEIQQKTQNLSEEEKVAKDFDNSSFFWILVSFFGFGILAAFTSCILPMIPILSSLIIGTDNPTKKKAFFMSLTFVIFMALTYAVVGVLAGMFGGNLQATFQNPWVIGSFSLMFVALAFSMFGYYEIKNPKLATIKTNYN